MEAHLELGTDIRKNYPKGYKEFTKWMTENYPNEEVVYFIGMSGYYINFFDEKEMYIEIDFDSYGCIWSLSLPTNNYYHGKVIGLDNRMQALKQAIQKAFEILEERLNNEHK